MLFFCEEKNALSEELSCDYLVRYDVMMLSSSGVNTAYRVIVLSVVETQARSEFTVKRSTVPYRTAPLSGNEAGIEQIFSCECGLC